MKKLILFFIILGGSVALWRGIYPQQPIMPIGESNMTVEFARKMMEPYFDDNGMITTDKAHEDGNDSPHKTGMYYMALALTGEYTNQDADKLYFALNTLTTKDGRLLRHRNTRLEINGHRLYWQEANRDQYTALMGALYYMRSNDLADMKRKDMWQLMKRSAPFYLTGDDVNPEGSDHWLYFARCGGEEISYLKRLKGDFIFLLGSLLTTYKTKQAVKEASPGGSPYSALVLRIAKSHVMRDEQPTFLSKFNHWLLGKMNNFNKAFDSYFSKSWDAEPDPPCHLMWRIVFNK
jgi:hypothetical protein